MLICLQTRTGRELPTVCVRLRPCACAFGRPTAGGMTRLRCNLSSALNKPRAKNVCSGHVCDQSRTQAYTGTNGTRPTSKRGEKYKILEQTKTGDQNRGLREG